MSTFKTIALVAATIAGTATIASANSSFPTGETFEQTDVLNFDIVRAEGAGMVEIYDYQPTRTSSQS